MLKGYCSHGGKRPFKPTHNCTAKFMTIELSVFNVRELGLIALDNAANSSSELLKNRLVCKNWKKYSDELIKKLWRVLKESDPRGIVNVRSAMDKIEEMANTNNFPLFKFAKLMRVFSQKSHPTAKNFTICLRSNDIRQLQQEELQKEYNKSLRKIWSQKLRPMLSL